MLKITNWQNATVFDIEADNLLEDATEVYILSYEMQDGKKGSIKGDEEKKLKNFFEYHRVHGIPIVAHNGIRYDVPLGEKLLNMNTEGLMVIDTLFLSWYLNTGRTKHGLDSFFEDYGIKKVVVQDHEWEEGDYELMKLRCEIDVEINKALWEDLKKRLVEMYTIAKTQIDLGAVGGTRLKGEECYIDSLRGVSVEDHIDSFLTFMMFKAFTARLREETRWKVDLELINKSKDELEKKLTEAKDTLESVMPQVAKYTKRNKPKVLKKKDGSYSVAGERWRRLVTLYNNKTLDENGNRIAIGVDAVSIKELIKYEDPNAGSVPQLKDWFNSLGWKPETFKFEVKKEDKQKWAESGFKKELKPVPRAIPQITKDGEDGKELCPSVIKLADKVPEVMSYTNYSMVSHRYSMFKGMIEAERDGYLKAEIKGMTNTFRDKHKKPLCNLPKPSKSYGKQIRGSLIAEEGETLLGTDINSLEDRVKHHFMLPIDPEYVNTMMEDDYDGHILNALKGNLITQDEFDDFKKGIVPANVSAARAIGKCVSYASVYNAGPEAIARAAGISIEEAKVQHKAYWELNWSVKQIAEEQVVVDYVYTIPATGELKKQRWLINPVNGFMYECRKDSDRFSTLCQGTGSFLFDCWIDNIVRSLEEKELPVRLCGNFHDETIVPLTNTDKYKDLYKGIIDTSLDKVNIKYKLRRRLGCDIQFGKNYSEIH